MLLNDIRAGKNGAVRRAALEVLETRRLFNNTYHDLSSGLFSQNWSNTGQLSVNDDWSNVPSVIGYRGDDLTVASGVDPQTVVAFAGTPAGPVVDINVNQTTPLTFASGGVTEFEITNPTVAFQGSGTADAPFILLHMNATGQTNVPVSYNLRDIDPAIDLAIQPVAAQYRVGETGDFTNIPGAFVANAASTVSGNDTQVTPVSFNLPAACDNQAQVQIRIITTNAGGNDQMIGIDDITVGTGVVAGSLAFSQGTYNVLENIAGGLATITINRSGNVNGAASVHVSSTNGTAVAPGDYTAIVDQIVSFADQQASANFTVAINNDTDPESLESFTLTMSQPTGADSGLPSTTTVNIVDNDSSAPAVVLNEVDVNPPGAGNDNPFEYVELRATGGGATALLNTYFISVEGDGGTTGFADVVISLGSVSTGTNGLLMIKSPTGGFTPDAATTVVTNAVFDQSGGILENGSNSFLIVFSQLPISVATDLDTNDDGTIDNLPAGASIIDGIGWKDTDAPLTDQAYGAILTQVTLPPPDAATRIVGNNNLLDPNAWYFGNLVDSGGGSNSVGYDPTAASTNLPAGAVVTPGAANFGVGDTTAPTVDSMTFDFDSVATPMNLQIDFSEDVQASLVLGTTLTLQNTTTSTFISAANMTLSYGAGDVAKISFQGLPGTVPSALPKGNYVLTATTGVHDTSNNALAAPQTLGFFFINGDASRDRAVGSSDFNLLASNFGAVSGKKFSQGDFTFNGAVDSADFNVLASNFGTSVAPGAGARGGSGSNSNGSLFGDGRHIGDNNDGDSILA